MTVKKHERAREILDEISEMKLVLNCWNALDRYCRPLKFRFSEQTDMDFVPEEALKQFKDACIAHINNRTKELEREFDKL